MNQIERQPELLDERYEQFFNDLTRKVSEIKRARQQLHPSDFSRTYKRWRRDFIQQYPEFQKMIETIFGINSFIRSHENFNYHREALVREQQVKELINLANWQHQATEVLVGFGWNKSLSEKFWQEVRSFYEIFSKYPEDFEGYKRGVTGQARAFLILQEIGYSPRLATPKEDVLEGTDFYIFLPGEKESEAIRTQIKLSLQRGESIVEVADCGSPSIIIDGEQHQTIVQEEATTKLPQIREICEKCGNLSQRKGKMVRFLVIILNENDFDSDGRPKPGLVEKIKAEIEKKLRQ